MDILGRAINERFISIKRRRGTGEVRKCGRLGKDYDLDLKSDLNFGVTVNQYTCSKKGY